MKLPISNYLFISLTQLLIPIQKILRNTYHIHNITHTSVIYRSILCCNSIPTVLNFGMVLYLYIGYVATMYELVFS